MFNKYYIKTGVFTFTVHQKLLITSEEIFVVQQKLYVVKN